MRTKFFMLIAVIVMAVNASAQVWSCHDVARNSSNSGRDSKYTIEFVGNEQFLVSRGKEYPQSWTMGSLESYWRENLPKYTFTNIQPVIYNGYLTWYFETVATGPHRSGAYVLNSNDYPVAVDYIHNGFYFDLWGGRAQVGIAFDLFGKRIQLGASTQKNYDGSRTNSAYASAGGKGSHASVGVVKTTPAKEITLAEFCANGSKGQTAQVQQSQPSQVKEMTLAEFNAKYGKK